MIGSLALVLGCIFPAANPVFDRLMSEGVPVVAGSNLRLPPPTMTDGLNAAGQQAALATVADENRPVEALLRNSVVSPFVLKIKSDEGTTGRHVDLWYVAHGSFDKITGEDFVHQQMKKAAQEKSSDELPRQSIVLKPEELQARGLTAMNSAESSESYVHTTFPLFDRVFISTSSQVVQSKTGDSVLISGLLDPRFDHDKDYPIFWQHLDRDDTGKLNLGEKLPYHGFGSYLKITRMIEPAGAIFVECHVAFDEPAGWFNGANLLRSKLPVLVQDSVRKFRREIQ
jgi:hypothetical protein